LNDFNNNEDLFGRISEIVFSKAYKNYMNQDKIIYFKIIPIFLFEVDDDLFSFYLTYGY
jgi:hypothetical protein